MSCSTTTVPNATEMSNLATAFHAANAACKRVDSDDNEDERGVSMTQTCDAMDLVAASAISAKKLQPGQAVIAATISAGILGITLETNGMTILEMIPPQWTHALAMEVGALAASIAGHA